MVSKLVKFLSVLMVIVVLYLISFCFVLMDILDFRLSDEQQAELEKAEATLNQSRPENAAILPDLSKDISDIRMTTIPRVSGMPFPFDYESFRILTLMQIWYGYYADDTWYDHPSENYDLHGIMKDRQNGILKSNDHQGWEAGGDSHIVKIGPNLLICLSLQDDPLVDYQISDTLNTQIQQPFEAYYTYHYYYDQDGEQHYYKDTHDHGYGYIAEDPASLSDPEHTVHSIRCEFPRRYYLILDYDALPDDYVLTLSETDRRRDVTETYTLTADMIHSLIEG